MKLESFDVEEGTGIIPEGKAEVIILSAETGNSNSDAETAQVALQYQNEEGEKLLEWRFITPNSIFRFNNLLTVCGIEAIEKATSKTIEAKASELIGKRLGIMTSETADLDGVMRNRVKDSYAV